jgi:hypothetical protein
MDPGFWLHDDLCGVEIRTSLEIPSPMLSWWRCYEQFLLSEGPRTHLARHPLLLQFKGILLCVCEEGHVSFRNMEGEEEGTRRLPIADPIRVAARDEKLRWREEHRADETGARSMWCPCCICGTTVSLRRKTVAQHLRTFKRHPRCRANLWVMCPLFISFTL